MFIVFSLADSLKCYCVTHLYAMFVAARRGSRWSDLGDFKTTSVSVVTNRSWLMRERHEVHFFLTEHIAGELEIQLQLAALAITAGIVGAACGRQCRYMRACTITSSVCKTIVFFCTRSNAIQRRFEGVACEL